MTFNKRTLFSLVLLGFLLAAPVACSIIGGEDAAATPDTAAEATEAPAGSEQPSQTAVAQVDRIEVLMLESFPVQVNVIASGSLPDACTTLNEPTPRREGNTFVVNLTTTRIEEEVCSQAQVSFDQVIPLDVKGLSAGTYTVSVNGITETFTLAQDNVPQEEPEPTPAEAAEEGSTISGQVWHDLCAVSGGEGEEPAVPSDGCIELDDGGYAANGQLEADEPGIEGVTVALGEGPCPADGLATTSTGADGAYSFTSLAPGLYCVSVDALQTENSSILIPGSWSAPDTASEDGTASAEVTVTAGGVSDDVNFGWDYQFLPEVGGEAGTEEPAAGTGDEAEDSCIDSAEFVADVTVQDNEIIPPGWVFTKTWRLRNDGTCPWTTNYDLVFVGGDRLGAPQEKPLPQEVAPEDGVNLSVQMVAPQANGTYRGNWQLRNEQGELFGIPVEGSFWLQIQVTGAIPEGGSVIKGLVWSDECEVIDDTPSSGCVEVAGGGFQANGTFDGGEPRIEGITVALAEGACPASSVIATSTTGADGRYSFEELEAGTYCVLVDPSMDDNGDVLLPGIWTAPEVSEEIVSTTVEVAAEEYATDVNFGWDYQAE